MRWEGGEGRGGWSGREKKEKSGWGNCFYSFVFQLLWLPEESGPKTRGVDKGHHETTRRRVAEKMHWHMINKKLLCTRFRLEVHGTAPVTSPRDFPRASFWFFAVCSRSSSRAVYCAFQGAGIDHPRYAAYPNNRKADTYIALQRK